MITELERATQTLRELVMAGRFSAGEKLPEEAVAMHLAVSRTIARLAMGALERDGLLARSPRRGYRVSTFTIGYVADAVEVRGELEAMAARQLAERGAASDVLETLDVSIRRSATLLREPDFDVQKRAEWARCNLMFHRALVGATGNAALAGSFEHLLRIPLVSPEVIVFRAGEDEGGRGQLCRAHADHVELLEAIRARRGLLAAEIMRAHAARSARYKRQNYTGNSCAMCITGARSGVLMVQADGGG